MFCTCSRSFSISDLISSASCVISRPSASLPGVFESSVLVSRCISCRRKSSFLPTSAAPAAAIRTAARGCPAARVLRTRRCARPQAPLLARGARDRAALRLAALSSAFPAAWQMPAGRAPQALDIEPRVKRSCAGATHISSHKCIRFVFAHAIEFVERLGEAARNHGLRAVQAPLRAMPPAGRSRPASRRIAARSGSDVSDPNLRPQRIRGLAGKPPPLPRFTPTAAGPSSS